MPPFLRRVRDTAAARGRRERPEATPHGSRARGVGGAHVKSQVRWEGFRGGALTELPRPHPRGPHCPPPPPGAAVLDRRGTSPRPPPGPADWPGAATSSPAGPVTDLPVMIAPYRAWDRFSSVMIGLRGARDQRLLCQPGSVYLKHVLGSRLVTPDWFTRARGKLSAVPWGEGRGAQGEGGGARVASSAPSPQSPGRGAAGPESPISEGRGRLVQRRELR